MVWQGGYFPAAVISPAHRECQQSFRHATFQLSQVCGAPVKVLNSAAPRLGIEGLRGFRARFRNLGIKALGTCWLGSPQDPQRLNPMHGVGLGRSARRHMRLRKGLGPRGLGSRGVGSESPP